MNILGSAYLTAKGRLRASANDKGQSRQSALASMFRNEWANGYSIDSDKLLANALASSSENVPFYQRYFAEHPERNRNVLNDWPVLTREQLCDHADDLLSLKNTGWETWAHASGGSTGKPVAVIHDEYFAAKAQALRGLCKELFFEGHHYNQLILWGMTAEVETQISTSLSTRVKDAARSFMGLKTTHINTFEFSKEKFEQCVDILAQQKPEFIFGYAGSIYELAKYLHEHDLRPARRPKMIGTTAQTLHPFMRECIERVFQCNVCDHYGSRETGPLAWQHRDGAMYFPSFFSKLEVVDEHSHQVPVGESGRILITTLHNETMPLIRYDIGDIGVRGEDKYCRGYPFATLREIAGRMSEEFINVNGSRICGPFFINLFYFRPWLNQFYIVQRDYALIEIMYIANPPYQQIPDDERESIENRIRSVMTEACHVKWQKVQKIPTTKAGKRLFIRSELRSAPQSIDRRQLKLPSRAV